jgi:autotransporter-associated beta strand protein
VAGDDLVFGTNAALGTRTTNNNIPSTPTPRVFKSITISAAGYSLNGNPIGLSGALNVGANLGNQSITMPMRLAPSSLSPQQTITVSAASTLSLNSGLTSTLASQSLIKAGTGVLELNADNSAYTGAIALANSGGVVVATTATALGGGVGTTTVNANAQLQIRPGADLTFNEVLRLNGTGVANDGALLNVTGNNTWAANIILDTSSSIGMTAGTSLRVTGLVSDSGAGQNLTKVGAGQAIFARPGGNTYRGTTTVTNGILTIRDPLSLGAGSLAGNPLNGQPQAGTIVTNNPATGEAGTLQLDLFTLQPNDPNGFLQNPALPFNATTNPYIGFQVFNNQLTLNGGGFGGIGALHNLTGNNAWSGDVTLASPPPFGNAVQVGVATGSELILSGLVRDPNQVASLVKVQPGRLVLSNSNTYRGGTFVTAGSLSARDSQALGTGGVNVSTGATLQMEVDSGIDGTPLRNRGRNLGFDSVNRSGASNLRDAQLTVTGVTGTFTISLFGQTTPAMAATVSAAVMQGNLNALLVAAGYSGATTTVTQAGSVYTIRYNGSLTDVSVPLPTVATFGPGAPTVVVGSAPVTRQELFLPNNLGSFTLNLFGQTSPLISAATLTPALLTTRINALLVAGGQPTTNVTVTEVATSTGGRLFRIRFNGALGNTNVPLLAVTNSVSNPPGSNANINNVYGLTIANALTLNGTGVANTGALLSVSGLNQYSGNITMNGLIGIGVDADARPGHPTQDEAYFDQDRFLRITGNLQDPLFLVGNLRKVGQGHLIIPRANGYTGFSEVQQGWVTIQNQQAFGNQISTSLVTTRPTVTVSDGAAVHIKPLTPGSTMTIPHNWNLAGLGIVHPFSKINQQGALENLQDANTLTGLVRLTGVAGIGVEQLVMPGSDVIPVDLTGTANPIRSELRTTEQISDATATPGGITKFGSRRLIVQAPSTYTGPVDITAGSWLAQTDTAFGQASGGVTVRAGASIELANTVPSLNGGIQAGVEIWGEQLTLNGSGNTFFNTAALTVLTANNLRGPVNTPIFSTDNIWQGPVELGTDATISTQPNGRIVFPGRITDTTNPSINGTNLTIRGAGEVLLQGANTYRGTTFVTEGVLRIGNGEALGSSGVPEIQTITITGAGVGTQIRLTFNGQQTGFIPISGIDVADAIAIRNALNLLTTVADSGNVASTVAGQVDVLDLAPGVFEVSFLAALSGFDQPLLTTTIAGPGGITVAETVKGSGGTVVSDGASLQLAGSFAVANEPLMLRGQGNANLPNVPNQWFSIGPSPSLNGQTAGSQAVTGRVTGAVVDPADANVIYIATAGGGAWKTIDGGLSWRQMFDQISEIQRVTVTATTGTYTLSLTAPDVTGVVVTRVTTALPFDATAAQIEAALNALSNIGGVNGSVTVTQDRTVAGRVFDVVFAGSLASTSMNQLASSAGATVVTLQDGLSSAFTMSIGAIAMDPLNSAILYLGTGETNNSSDSFYGTGIYKSTDRGLTWRLVVDTVSLPGQVLNPFAGQGISKIVPANPTQVTTTDPFNPIDLVLAARLTNGLFVATGEGGNAARNETQRLSFAGFSPGNTFTLSYTGRNINALLYNDRNVISTQTTGLIAFGGTPAITAGNIQTALNGLSNIGPAGGVVVTPISNGPAGEIRFHVTFQTGALANTDVALLTSNANLPGPGVPLPTLNIEEQVRGGVLPKVVNGGGGNAGVWRYESVAPGTPNTGSWTILTNTVSANRATLAGQLTAPPNTPGPDDDFRIQFPQRNVTWSDLEVVYADPRAQGAGGPALPTPPGIDFIRRVPIVFASLGSAQGNANNGLFRSETPMDAAPVWYVGDQGVPQNQVTRITFTGTGPIQYNLRFRFIPPTTNQTAALTFINNVDQSAAIQAALNALPSIGGLTPPGNVTVTQVSVNVNTTVYDVTFGGSLALTPVPLITAVTQPGLTFSAVIQTPGGGADTRSGNQFPTGATNPSLDANFRNTFNGNIKFSVVSNGGVNLLNNYVVYASVPRGDNAPPVEFSNQIAGSNLRWVQRSANGGRDWAAVAGTGLGDYLAGPPTPGFTEARTFNFGNPTKLGSYNNAILAVSAGQVYVGGTVNNNGTQAGQIFVSNDSGANWADLSVNAGGPHTSQHDIVLSGNQLLFLNDGGIWRLNPLGNSWSNLNGNLAISQFNGIAGDPTDTGKVFGAVQSNATQQFTNALAWSVIDKNAGGQMSGNQIYVDPSNSNILYAVQTQLGSFNPGDPLGVYAPSTVAVIRKSTNGGQTWTTILNSAARPDAIKSTVVPLVLDRVNPARLLVGGVTNSFVPLNVPPLEIGRRRLLESLDGGVTWRNVDPIPGNPVITAIGLAAYQGPFQPDPGFTLVTDQGTNAYVPGTIYVTNGTGFWVTKDNGLSWQNRSAVARLADAQGSIQQIVVDPRNSNTVYVVRSAFGADKVLRSTDAGQTWTEIGTSNGLANVPVWSLVVDPRNDNLYVGTDIGVFQLEGGTGTWKRFGANLPLTQIRTLELNQSTNTLLAGTYGRSAYQIFLKPNQTAQTLVPAALVGLSGTTFWNGPVVVDGEAGSLGANAVTIGAYGTQVISDGIVAASLNVVGTISDVDATSNARVIKIGLGDVIFSGPNVYGGQTEVRQGALVSDNPQALGGTTANTTVFNNAALNIRSNLGAEPITINGNGLTFDAHFTGALRNIAGDNTYEGPLTLSTIDPITFATLTTATIGADSGSQLTMTGGINGGAAGFVVAKEGTGTITYAGTNSSTSRSDVYRGALGVRNNSALTTDGARVLDGGQMQIASTLGMSPSPVTITAPLELSGGGINNTGALLNLTGNNTWSGPITFTTLPGFTPFTTPGGSVTLASNDDPDTTFLDTLTINGVINEVPGAQKGLRKVGTGTVALRQDNNYSGGTYVEQGTLTVQDPGALGDRNPARPGIQQVVTLHATPSVLPVAGEIFTISFTAPDFTGVPVTIQQTFNFTTANQAAAIQTALNGFANIGGVGGSVTVVPTEVTTTTQTGANPPNTGFLYTITFGGTLAQTSLPLSAFGNGPVTAAASIVANGDLDTLVSNGASLRLDNSKIPAGVVVPAARKVNINGTGVGGLGALQNGPGNNTWAGTVVMDVASSIGAAENSSLTLPLQVVGNPGDDLTKVDDGTLILNAAVGYAGRTVITNGSVQVGGSLPNVLLNNDPTDPDPQLTPATISGTGTVDVINSANGGRVYPGNNSDTNPIGTLTANNVDLTALDTVFVDLGNPVNLPKNDLLAITGTLNINGATLDGLVDPNVQIDDDFIVIEAAPGGAINGQFAGVVVDADTTITYIEGLKFLVEYEDTNSDLIIDRVRLIRKLAQATMSLAPTTPTPVYGEVTQFIAALTPEIGAPSPTGFVVFTVLDPGSNFRTYSIPINVSGQAIFDPTTAAAFQTGGVPLANAPFQLGTYTVTAAYNGVLAGGQIAYDPVSAGPSSILVSAADTNTVLTSSRPNAANPPVTGEAYTITATVASALAVTATGTLAPAGTVDFFLVPSGGPNILLGSATLNSLGIGTLSSTSFSQQLLVGIHTLIAVYNSDGAPDNYNGSTSAAITQRVAQASTTTTVTSSSPTSNFGNSVTFTAFVAPVSPGIGTPTGTVRFVLGATPLGTATLFPSFGGATASISISTLNAGLNQPITAFYDEAVDPNFGPSFGAVNQNVRGLTTTALSVSSTTPVIGQAIQLTATVNPTTAPGSSIPGVVGGTVTFFDGATALATVPLVNGVATLLSPLGGSGARNVTAVYNGNASPNAYAGSSSSAISVFVNGAGSRASTSAFTAPALTTSFFGQAVTFTVRVIGGGTAPIPTPTGSVEFRDGPTLLGYGLLTTTAGVTTASFTTSSLAVGPHTITARFSGSTVYAAGPLLSRSHTVNAVGTRTSATSPLLVSSSPSVFSQAVTLTTTISDTGALPAANPAAGGAVVTFFDGPTFLGFGTLTTIVPGTIQASLTLTNLAVGPHNFTAQYSGNATFAAGPVVTASTVVNKANTAVALVSNRPASSPGLSVTFTATVTRVAPATINPTTGAGTVTFLNQTTGAVLAVVPLTGNVATFTTTALPRGTFSIVAIYSGDMNFNTSTSNVVLQAVKVGTRATLAASTNQGNTPINLTATILPTSGTGVPTGTVQFIIDGVNRGTVSMVNGRATLSLPGGLPFGRRVVRMVYSGDDSFLASTTTVNLDLIIGRV